MALCTLIQCLKRFYGQPLIQQVAAPKLHKSQTSLQHAAAHKALASMNRRSPALAPKPPLPPYSSQPPPINTSSKERLQVSFPPTWPAPLALF